MKKKVLAVVLAMGLGLVNSLSSYSVPQIVYAIDASVTIPDAAKVLGEEGSPKDGITSVVYNEGTNKDENGNITSRYLSSVTVNVSDCDKLETLLNQAMTNNGATISNIKLDSVAGEGASYSGTYYITTNNNTCTVIQPKWFEGPQTVKLTLALGGNSVTYNIQLPRENPVVYTEEQQATIKDYIFFGNAESEANNQFESIRTNDPVEHTFQNQKFTYRTLAPRGSMAVTLKCDPEKQNYFTIKLWGNDTIKTANGMLWLVDPSNNKIGVSPYNNAKEEVNMAPMQNGAVDRKQWVKLSFLDGVPQCENGFIYSTYKIPTQLTRGKEYISLRVYSTGNNANYSSISIGEQTGNSRRVYAAFMTQKAAFYPEDFSRVGEVSVRGSITQGVKRYDVNNASNVTSLKNAIKNYAKSEVDIFKNRQVYSGNSYLPALKGMFTRRTNASSVATSKTSDVTIGSGNSMNAQNMEPLHGMAVLAYAYAGDFYTTSSSGKAELLDRIVNGFDYLARAQGSNGGLYQRSDNTYQWVGGPNRIESGGNNLTGFGLRSVGEAFLVVNEANPTALTSTFETMIDSDADDNNTTDQKRVLAYAALFSKARDFLESPAGAGHAPNQDMADIIALLRFDQALEIIDEYIKNNPSIYPNPSAVKEQTFGEYSYPFAWRNQKDKYVTIYEGRDYEATLNGPERLQNSIDIGVGIKPNISTYSYWVSPKGVLLENFGSINGGYTGDYGTAAIGEMSEIVEMAAEHYYPDNKEFYWDIMNRAYDAVSNFYFVQNDGSGNDTLYSEGIISERNAAFPGAVRYVLDPYSAVHINDGTGNVVALKIMQYYFEHGRLDSDLGGSNLTNNGYAHFESEAIANVKLYYAIEEIIANITEEVKEYDFPGNVQESNTITAWADEMAQVVTMDFLGEKIYMNINFRTWMHSQGAYNHWSTNRILPSTLARYHRKTAGYDNYGYADSRVYGWSYQNPTGGWNYSNDYIEAMFITEYNEDITVLMNTTGCGLDYCGKGDPIDYTGEQLGLNVPAGEYVDLISGEEYVFEEAGAKTLSVPANTTIVLMYKGALEAHTVTYIAEEGVTVPEDGNTYNKGTTVTVSSETPVKEGYEFTGWLNESSKQTVLPGSTFLMGKDDVVLTATWQKIHNINLSSFSVEDEEASGTVQLYMDDFLMEKNASIAGKTIVVDITPAEGSRLVALETTIGGVKTNVTEQVEAYQYQFVMPEQDVSILALFKETEMKRASIIASEDRTFRVNNTGQKGTSATLELRNNASGELDRGFVAGLKFNLSSLLQDMDETDTINSFRLQMISNWAPGSEAYRTHAVSLFSNDWAESPDNRNQYSHKQSYINSALSAEPLTQIVAKGYEGMLITNNMVYNDRCSLEQYRSVSGDMADSMNRLVEDNTFATDTNISFLISSTTEGTSSLRFFSKDVENESRNLDGIDYTEIELAKGYNCEVNDFKPTLLIEYGPELPDVAEESQQALEMFYEGALEYALGDTNNDGNVTAVDALIALKYSLGNHDLNTMTKEERASYKAARVSGGETVSVVDVLAILEAAANHATF